jgi:geranylgeranyl diphosphate synthase, type I
MDKINNSFLGFVANNSSNLDNSLKNNLEIFKKYFQLHKNNSFLKELLLNIEEFVLRDGKRIRPMLVLLGHEISFKKNISFNSLCNAASIIEMIHAFFLIHDDVMDRSQLRRNKKTIHELYKYDSTTNSELYGNNIAIVAGDLLLSFAYKRLLEIDMELDKRIIFIKLINDIIIDTCIGQAFDLNIQNKSNVLEEDIMNMYLLKTARYSISGPLKIGLILNESSNNIIDSIDEYGSYLGKAFQIKDDLLDIFSDSDKIGKKRFSDFKEGKKTLILVKTLKMCNNSQKKFILDNLGKEIDDSIGNKIKDIIVSCGAEEEVKNEIKSLVKKSTIIVHNSSFDNISKKYLLDFLEYLVNREK